MRPIDWGLIGDPTLQSLGSTLASFSCQQARCDSDNFHDCVGVCCSNTTKPDSYCLVAFVTRLRHFYISEPLGLKQFRNLASAQLPYELRSI